eukprot:1141651-Pelagomonas_calceolata.AAC.2
MLPTLFPPKQSFDAIRVVPALIVLLPCFDAPLVVFVLDVAAETCSCQSSGGALAWRCFEWQLGRSKVQHNTSASSQM